MIPTAMVATYEGGWAVEGRGFGGVGVGFYFDFLGTMGQWWGMKISSLVLKAQVCLVAGIFVAAAAAYAQPGGGMGGGAQGAQFSGALEKIFGDNKAFSATMSVNTGAGPTGEVSFETKMACLDNVDRVEMDMSKMTNAQMPAQAMDAMKKAGMDKSVTISDKDKKMVYMVYPAISAYVAMPIPGNAAPPPASAYKMESTELASETVGGHACAKDKVVVTYPDGTAHEFTVWFAKDLKKFPVKITTAEGGMSTTMTFKDIKLEKPDEAQFRPPTGYKKYDNMMQLMMTQQKMAPGAHP
jgi:hypothetical protein